jgi:hypothetical protein
MRASQPLCVASEAGGYWPNSECHSKNAQQRGRRVQILERLVIGPGSSRFVSYAALFKQVERTDGERSLGACANVDVNTSEIRAN